MTFRADLHCHTTCSDGTNTPLEILIKAKEIGLKGLSITDHDSISAYTPELFSSAKCLEISILPGIELSSEYENQTVHVLGYGFDLKSSFLQEFIQEMQIRRNHRNRLILEKLKQKDIIIAEEELFAMKNQTIGRPHIAALMIKKGYVATMQQAFEGYLKEKAPCYVSGFKFTPFDAIHAIHEANGKAVLAHPHFIQPKSFLKKLLAQPFDGIECYYGTLHKHLEIPWVQIAKGKGWIATGGSDYHGTIKPHISLGCSWVNEATFLQLMRNE